MDRKLLVTLLQKNIRELEMITAGFMEMTEYPAVIIRLARQKTEDILDYVAQLENINVIENSPQFVAEAPVEVSPISRQNDTVVSEPQQFQQQEEESPVVSEMQQGEDQAEPEAAEEAESPELLEPIVEVQSDNTPEPDFVQEQQQPDQAGSFEEETEEVLIEETIMVEQVEEQTIIEVPASVEEESIEEDEQEEPEIYVAEKIVMTETTVNIKEEKVVVESVSRNESTVADTINSKKIDDVRQAISIGDRFRFQRELFDGNGELMNKTFSTLNQMNNLDEAMAYLYKKFDWNEEDETVDNFYQIVGRRFL